MKGAVFDWDGTLADIDSREFYCINEALRLHGRGPVTHDFFVWNYYKRAFEVGTGPRMVLEAALEGNSVEEAYETYRGLFAKTVAMVRLQEGALETLQALKKHSLMVGVATMRYARAVVATELGLLGVEPYVDVLLTREDLGLKRTLGSLEETVDQRVRLVAKALEQLGLAPDEAFLVGDSWWDIRAGKRLKMRTVMVPTGFSSHNDFSDEKPDVAVRSLRDLLAMIMHLSF